MTCDENECRLAVDTVENIVAIAKVIDVGGESSNQLLNGVPLGENNMRVSVIRAIEGGALVPIPVRDEIITVDDAVGGCVAWPKDLVVTHGAKAVTATTETNVLQYICLMYFIYVQLYLSFFYNSSCFNSLFKLLTCIFS